MMGQSSKPEEQKQAFDNDKLDETIDDDDEVEIAKEDKELFSDTDDDDDDVHMRFSKHLQAT